MEQHVSWISQVVNHFLGGIARALLAALHIQPSHPEMPIPEHVCMGFFVLVAGTLLALLVRSRLSVERPGAQFGSEGSVMAALPCAVASPSGLAPQPARVARPRMEIVAKRCAANR